MRNKKLFFLFSMLFLFFLCAVVTFAVEGSGGITSWFSDLAGFFKRLIVPKANYFHIKLAELSQLANDRLGGVAYLYLMLNDFFKNLSKASSAGLVFSLPNGYFFEGFQGLSVNVFQSAQPYIKFLRDVLTTGSCLLTAIVCYHKLRKLFVS